MKASMSTGPTLGISSPSGTLSHGAGGKVMCFTRAAESLSITSCRNVGLADSLARPLRIVRLICLVLCRDRFLVVFLFIASILSITYPLTPHHPSVTFRPCHPTHAPSLALQLTSWTAARSALSALMASFLVCAGPCLLESSTSPTSLIPRYDPVTLPPWMSTAKIPQRILRNENPSHPQPAQQGSGSWPTRNP